MPNLVLYGHSLANYRGMFNLVEDEFVKDFHLLNQQGDITSQLDPMMLALGQQGLGVEIKEVGHRLQKKRNALLRVWSKSCSIVNQ